MPRRDLLALTHDDLAALANRGLVKRAQRDIDTGAGPTRVHETPHGAVEADWTDPAKVELKPDQPINDRACSCAALTVCRHIIGTVLAYQAQTPAVDKTPTATPWNPGEITDETLAKFWTPAELATIDKMWQAGVVAELYRGVKPVARLVSIGITLRFLVPFDARYVKCDCAEPAPCRHVALAVRAFRELPRERATGLVYPNEARFTQPTEMIAECEQLVHSLFTYGLASLPPTDVRRWEALPSALKRRSLLWPSEIAADILNAQAQYRSSDARFDSAVLARLAAELLIRMRAIGAAAGAVPQLFLRGASSADRTALSFARLTGLGCHVSVRRKSVVLTLPLQDLTTGTVAVAQREFVDPAGAPAREFATLAAGAFAKEATFARLGDGHLLIQGAVRNANAEISALRARFSLSPQAFEWEKLRAPVLLEDFAELIAHREAQPHAMLRPRRLCEDIHVLPVSRVDNVTLDAVSRRLIARLIDSRGDALTLIQPFFSRGRSGFSKMREVLETEKLCYVSGIIRGLTIEPVAVVYERDGRRQMLQPWISSSDSHLAADWTESAKPTGALVAFLDDISAALGEAALVGLAQSDSLMQRRWDTLIEQGQQLGLERALTPVHCIAAGLATRAGSLAWDSQPTAAAAVGLAIVAAYGATV